MNTHNEIVFIIALKRYRKNSVILNEPVYKACKRYNICEKTYKKYFNICLEKKYIIKDGDRFIVRKLKTILTEHYKGSHVCFKNHRMLKKSKSLDFNKIKFLFEQYLVEDNIIRRQQKKIHQKINKIGIKNSDKYRLDNGDSVGTGNKWQSDLSLRFRDKLNPKVCVRRSKNSGLKNLKQSNYLFNNRVVTSARNTARILGFSVSKSNEILNRTDVYSRHGLSVFIKGCNVHNIEYAKNAFDGLAHIAECPYQDGVRVHFGSELNMNSDEQQEKPVLFSKDIPGIEQTNFNLYSLPVASDNNYKWVLKVPKVSTGYYVNGKGFVRRNGRNQKNHFPLIETKTGIDGRTGDDAGKAAPFGRFAI